MNFLKKVVVFVFVVVSCLLAATLYLDNSDPEVSIRLFSYNTPVLSIGYWVIIFFAGGLLIGVIGNFFVSVKSFFKIRDLEKKLKHKQAELDLLKSQSS
ncbi:MAG: LapA family protein [Pseudomonadales bacterium]|nr:LapA family protein [Pseudomonadales bacterium]